MATKKARFVAPVTPVGSITVSPDGSQLLYSQLDRSGANVLLADTDIRATERK